MTFLVIFILSVVISVLNIDFISLGGFLNEKSVGVKNTSRVAGRIERQNKPEN